MVAFAALPSFRHAMPAAALIDIAPPGRRFFQAFLRYSLLALALYRHFPLSPALLVFRMPADRSSCILISCAFIFFSPLRVDGWLMLARRHYADAADDATISFHFASCRGCAEPLRRCLRHYYADSQPAPPPMMP